jgi:HlyD family type I secretion membrane fusion protein
MLVPQSTQVLPAIASNSSHGADAPLGDPRFEIRAGLMVAALFFLVFLGWATFARLDAAAYAPGVLAVAGQRQAVQHRDGGVVGEILVKEGQRVTNGQILLRLAAADVRAQERSLSSRIIGLLAQRARLEAEQMGSRHVQEPHEFAELSQDRRAEAASALKLQQSQLEARLALLSAEQGVFGQRSAQAALQGSGFGQQVSSISEQIRLIDQELDSLRPLAEKGFVSKSRIRALERAKAELQGQKGQYTATIAQTREAVGESRLQAVEAERSYRSRTADEWRDVQSSLDELMPQLEAARDRLARTEIRAPATGIVVGLAVFTPGGVISPGQKLMEIVPNAAPLLIEARISPDDADDVQTGQTALVRFESLHDRRLPNLEGIVTRISADRFVDERNGQSYFTAEVKVPFDQLKSVQKGTGRKSILRAGMPVEILIPLRKRSALQYAFEPLAGAFWKSFREQ